MLSNELFYVFYSSLVTLDSALLLLTQTPETFTYDPVGNRETSADYSDWDYNSRNQLTGYNGISFRYDDNGNTVKKIEGADNSTYIYNYENRLKRIDFSDGGYAQYKYDAAGRRIEKNVDGTVTKYLYDGTRLLAEYDGSDQLLRNYYYGPGDINPSILSEGGTLYFYYRDHLNTPQVITDETGVVKWEATYNAFGEVNITTDTIVNNFRFPGQYFDAESDLYYNYFRYYNPGTGRYLREDPLNFTNVQIIKNNPYQHISYSLAGQFLFQYALMNPGFLNVYKYTQNNPINWTDPEGNVAWVATGAVAGAVAGAAGGAIGGLLGSNGSLGGTLGGALGGAIGGLAGGALNPTGSVGAFWGGFGSAATAALAGANFGGIAGAALGGGLVGGITSGVGPLAGTYGSAFGPIAAGTYGMAGQGLWNGFFPEGDECPSGPGSGSPAAFGGAPAPAGAF